MHRALPLLLAFSLTVGCSSDSASVGDKDIAPPDLDVAGTYGDDDDDQDTTLPPEDEDKVLPLPPAQTDIFVFVANPKRNTVTRINVRDIDVDTVPVGIDPRIVMTTPDYSGAVVFNRGDDSVTILDADTLDSQTVAVRDNHNQMAMSPDGAWVVLWHDIDREEPDDPQPEGLQSFNEASFVDVATGEHTAMAVGFDPSGVRFTPDGSTVVIVSDAYLAVVDLTEAPLIPKLIELSPDLIDPPKAEEVVLAPDASFAFVRQFGGTELLVVEVATGQVSNIAAGLEPTDLDLTPDGQQAVVVARGSQELWVYDATDPFGGPPQVLPFPAGTEPRFGSLVLDPTGQVGVLYTTAVLTERYMTWDRASDTLRERALVKPVQGVAVTPTGESLMVFHTAQDGPETEPLFAGQWALTLIDLGDFRSNPLLLPGEPISFANSNNGNFGYFAMEGERYLEILDYRTLLHTQIGLKSDPVFVGVLPDLDLGDGDEPQAWASQEHDLGRISFYDPDDGSVETLTGFELNSQVEEHR